MGLKAVSNSGGGGSGPTTNPVSRAQGGSGSTYGADTATGNFSVYDYGAKWDGVRVFDGVITANSNQLSSATHAFVAADVGKCVTASQPINQFSGAPIAIPVFTGTILSVAAGVATLSGNQTSGVTTGYIVAFGTDDTVALQNAINAACPLGTPTNPTNTANAIQGGTIILPMGIGMTTAPLIMRTNVSFQGQGMNASCIKWVSTHSMGTGYEAMFVGITANGSSRWYANNEFLNFEIDMDAAQVNSGYTYHAKAFEIIYMLNPRWDNMYIHGTPATSVGCDFVSGLIFTNNFVANAGHLKTGTLSPVGGCGISWETGVGPFGSNVGYNDVIISNNVFFNCHNSAIEPEATPLGTAIPALMLIDSNIIITNQTFGNGIRDKGATGATITNNICICTATQTTGVGIGTVYTGINGVIANNYVQGFYNGMTIEDNLSPNNSSNNYSVRGNTIESSVNNGLQIIQNSVNILKTLNITDNYIESSGSAGIAFVYTQGIVQSVTITNAGSGYTAGTYALGFSGGGGSGATGTYTVNGTLTVVSVSITAGGTGYTSAPTVSFPSGGGSAAAGTASVNVPGTIDNLLMVGNTCANNGKTTVTDAQKSGILVQDIIIGAKISDNYCFDSGAATQKYGITVDTAGSVTNAMVTDNKLNDNTTATGINIVGTLTGWIQDNWGYNPLGASSLSPGASPWTYTAGSTPEIIYLYGGTVSSVAKNSVTLATALSATTSLPVALLPGESMTVTYTVAPTAVKDRR